MFIDRCPGDRELEADGRLTIRAIFTADNGVARRAASRSRGIALRRSPIRAMGHEAA
jgi:hypothetical protein